MTRDPERAYRSVPEGSAPLFETANLSRPEAGIRDGATPSMPQVHTRKGMPQTSFDAARTVTNLGPTKDRILLILRTYGPQTDEGIAEKWNTIRGAFTVSPSGLRTRRSWLVDHGFIEACPELGKTQSGRSCTIWRLKK